MSQPVVCCFESRRADEMRSLIERHGGVAVAAPSMQEIPIENNPDALEFIRKAIDDVFPVVILMTGVGTEALFEVARSNDLYDDLLQAMHRTTIVIRGPKPAVALSKVGLKYALKAPEPNTWRELLQALDESAVLDPVRYGLSGRPVAVQEYGMPNRQLYIELEARGAIVTRVPVYRWTLPDEIQPLKNAVRDVVAGCFDIVMFTSANQVTNVLTIAEQESSMDGFRMACAKTLVASIGPTCSEALRDHGFTVGFEASPPKMGPMVRGAFEQWRRGSASL